ncbi:MAG: HD domain-containing phosphohydrolase [Planctomycetota bacterium]
MRFFRTWFEPFSRREKIPAGGIEEIREIPLGEISPNPYQPRKFFDPDELTALADSIRTHGVIVPIIVRKVDSGYETIAGERRIRACRRLGRKTIPAIVLRLNMPGTLEASFIENIPRGRPVAGGDGWDIESLRREFSAPPGARTGAPPPSAPPDPLSEELATAVKHLYSVRPGSPVDRTEARRTAEKLLAETRLNRMPLNELRQNTTPGDFLPRHALGRAAIALRIGMAHGLPETDLRNLGEAALLHDIGMTAAPERIIHKPGPLSEEEWDIVRAHSEQGVAMLTMEATHMSPPREDADAILRRVVAETHERSDGSGYPGGLAGDAIHPFAKITALADAYAALTAARPWRAAWPPATAIGYILYAALRGHFDKTSAGRLAQALSLYPIGSAVRISTRETATVVAANPGDIARPVVRVERDPKGNPVEPPRLRDLAIEKDVSIARGIGVDAESPA